MREDREIEEEAKEGRSHPADEAKLMATLQLEVLFDIRRLLIEIAEKLDKPVAHPITDG